MAALSEWLELMLAEIARKREDVEREREEEAKRDVEARESSPPPERKPRAARR